MQDLETKITHNYFTNIVLGSLLKGVVILVLVTGQVLQTPIDFLSTPIASRNLPQPNIAFLSPRLSVSIPDGGVSWDLGAMGTEDYGGHGISYKALKKIIKGFIWGINENDREIPSSTLVTRSASKILKEPVRPNQLIHVKVTKLSEGQYEWIIHIAADVQTATGERKPFRVILDIGKYVGQVEGEVYQPGSISLAKKEIVGPQYARLTQIKEQFLKRAKEIQREVDWDKHVVSIYDFESLRFPREILTPIDEEDGVNEERKVRTPRFGHPPRLKTEFLEVSAYAVEVMDSAELNLYEYNGMLRVGTLYAPHSASVIEWKQDIYFYSEFKNIDEIIHRAIPEGDVIFNAKASNLYLEEMSQWLFMPLFAGVKIYILEIIEILELNILQRHFR
jgi:hypothetical protein